MNRESYNNKICKNYKGGYYQVIDDSALHMEDHTKLVVYRSLSTGSVLVLPYDSFFSFVSIPLDDNYDRQVERFKFLLTWEEYCEANRQRRGLKKTSLRCRLMSLLFRRHINKKD